MVLSSPTSRFALLGGDVQRRGVVHERDQIGRHHEQRPAHRQHPDQHAVLVHHPGDILDRRRRQRASTDRKTVAGSLACSTTTSAAARTGSLAVPARCCGRQPGPSTFDATTA